MDVFDKPSSKLWPYYPWVVVSVCAFALAAIGLLIALSSCDDGSASKCDDAYLSAAVHDAPGISDVCAYPTPDMECRRQWVAELRKIAGRQDDPCAAAAYRTYADVEERTFDRMTKEQAIEKRLVK